MAQGLQVFNASGGLMMDSSMRFSTFHARYVVNPNGATSYLINIPGFRLDGTWAAYCSEFYVSVEPINDGIILRGARRSSGTYHSLYGDHAVYVFRS